MESCAEDEIVQGRPVAWICNTPRGVVYRRQKGDVVDETILLDAYIESATLYRDVVTGAEYVDAVVVAGGTRRVYKMRDPDAFIEDLERAYRRARWRLSWRPVLSSFPHVDDYLLSGFACPQPGRGLRCGVRDYFGAGIQRGVTRQEAREAFEALRLDRRAATAYAYALFQTFTLTRKLWGREGWIVTLAGPGKDSMALLALRSLFPDIADWLVVSGDLTPAKVGKLPIPATAAAFVGRLRDEAAYAVLKSYTNALTVREHAGTGRVWPGYAGPILVSDAVVPSLFIPVEEPVSARGNPAKFGGYYMEYAEKNWEAVKDVVLGGAEAPRRYFELVLEDLGITAEVGTPADLRAPDALQLYLAHLYVATVQIASKGGALQELLRRGAHPLAQPHDSKTVKIPREEAERLGIDVNQLCAKLGGRKYYGHCVAPTEKLLEAYGKFLEL